MLTRISILFFLLLFVQTVSYCQKGYLPDDNFEQALIDLGYDTAPLDDSVTISEVEGLLELDIIALGIEDLTGIKYFTALERLDCSLNSLSALDFTYNVNLEELNCELNGLFYLDVTGNIALKRLFFGYNELSSIDVSNNFLLEELSFVGNSITTINLLENSELIKLVCTGNLITSLNLNGNPNLEWLECSATSMTTLDILSNGSLKTLICASNGFNTIDLSNASELLLLKCEANELIELDLSHSPLLEEVYAGFNHINALNFETNSNLKVVDVRNNELTFLDMRNGENPLIEIFKATDNPTLTCINVDDVEWSNENWTEVDETAEFLLDCNLALPDLSFEFAVYPNPTQSLIYIQTYGPFNYEIYAINGELLQSGNGDATSKIDLSNLTAGMYILNVLGEMSVNSFRIVKE